MRAAAYLVLFLLLICRSNSVAQDLNNESVLNQQSDTVFNVPYAQPVKLNFHVPIKIDHYEVDRQGSGALYTVDHGTSDSSIDQAYTMSKTETLVQSFELNNQFTLTNYIGQGYGTLRIIKFSIDTTKQFLENIYIYQSWGSVTSYGAVDSFTITSIPYSIMWNHHLYASSQGNDLFLRLSRAYFISRNLTFVNQTQINDTYESRGFSTDTVSCRFSIDIASTDPAFGVSMQKDLNGDFLTAKADALSDLLTFSFSSSSQNRELKIYDLMGREVYRNSVSQEISSLLFSKNVLPSGCFIAQLGNSRAKFILTR